MSLGKFGDVTFQENVREFNWYAACTQLGLCLEVTCRSLCPREKFDISYSWELDVEEPCSALRYTIHVSGFSNILSSSMNLKSTVEKKRTVKGLKN